MELQSKLHGLLCQYQLMLNDQEVNEKQDPDDL